MDRLVVDLQILEALKSLVGGVGLMERNLNLAEGGAGRRRAVH